MAEGFKVAQGYVEVDVDYAALDKSVAGIEARLKSIRDVAINAGVNQKALDASLALVQAKLNALKMNALSIGGIDYSTLAVSLAEIQMEMEAFARAAKVDVAVTGLPTAVAELMAFKTAADAAAGSGGGGGGVGGGTGILGLAFAGTYLGRILGGLNVQIPLFGGLLSGIPFVRYVGGVHLFADSILEIGAVLIPAAVALGAFGAAAAGTVNDIMRQEQAYLTMQRALGTAIPGLTKGLQDFQDSVKPQVYILFGEALQVVNDKTGAFQKLATGAGQVLDNLGARAALALGGGGLSGLLSKGDEDLQLLGNIFGNVFGIIGNLLKTLPGYAQLLFTGLQDITGAIEAITASGFVQWLLGVGLAFHGAILWGGLAVSAIMLLQGPLMAVVGWVGGAVNALVKFGVMFSILVAQEGILGAATITLTGIMDALSAVNPFVWVAVAIGALVGLVVWLGNTKTAAQQAYSSLEASLAAATTFVQANTILTQGLQQTNAQLKTTTQTITEQVVGIHGLSHSVTELNPAYQQLQANAKAYTDQQQTLTTRMNELDKVTGSQATSLSDLNSIGVKAGSIATESASAFANQLEQIKALTLATTQLAGYQSGQAAAAQNALTNTYMQETLPAIQKITQAETNLINVITGGQTAFDTFELNMYSMNSNLSAAEATVGTTSHTFDGLRSAASLAGAAMAGTSQASYTLNQAFYGQINSAQNVISALMAQSISQKDLTKVVATSMEQMLQYAGSNTAARSTMVDLINNALGPGTVTLKSLNQWVGTNSTSLSNMNNIVGESTVKAGGLNSVLSATLKSMQAVALFQSQGGQSAWNNFVKDIENGTTSSKNFRQSTIDVMTQLYLQANNSLPAAQRAFENFAIQGLGLTKSQADTLWHTYLPGLQNEINGLHGKDLPINVTASGSGGISISGYNLSGPEVDQILLRGMQLATGGKIPGYGGGDIHPALLEAGETVVSKEHSSLLAPVFKAVGVPGYASGGLAGSLANLNTGSANFVGSSSSAVIQNSVTAVLTAMKKAVSSPIPGDYSPIAGVTQWETDVLKVLAMEGLSSSLLRNVIYQMQTESGGNPNAINLTDSNAAAGDPSRGLMQVIMSTFLAYHWPGTSMNIYDPIANIAAALNYARNVYGPSLMSNGAGIGSGHGYAAGGFLPPGKWGYVGEHGREIASARPGGGVDIHPLANAKSGSTINMNYFGTQYPTAEQRARQRIDLAMLLGVAP